ncbi:hypothetical protein BC940DRAFT_1942 [Gongronella butleri]|nr:hypothetical protein BC940DRAFT_1942 [Gongronella butleri]
MTFTKQFSPNGNIGDIVAKDDAQMSTAHLLGMLSGVGLIAVCDSPAFLFTMFAILSPINIWSTYRMIQASKFEILNQAKATLLTRAFIDMGHVQTYDELAPKEIGFGEWIKPGKGNIRFKIHMGASADEAFRCAEEVSNATTILGAEQYLLNFDAGKNTMAILYHDDAAPRDILKSILHANKMHDHLDAQKINKDTHWDAYWQAMADSRDWTNANLDAFVQSLDDYKWQRETVYWNDTGKRVTWDRA